MKHLPSFVCLFHDDRERAAVLKSFDNGANSPVHILFSAQNLSEYLYVDV